ncbi:DNA cytosine methyltransferase [Aeromonas caviae]|uniref:DNA cytosine methyltransferase n=1 Tax=Aeromonas caviae TaxID=648 RepID=A0AAJ5ZFY6_AERCA|nr:DNA cytosine methyltransferase [Aeromonas caviae]WFG00367.1 DNA cytosine methyltransferase [Aeromonas caviae]
MTPHFSQPDLITKQLAFNRVGDRRKVRLSTNFLPVMGFQPGQGLNVRPLGYQRGFAVELAGGEKATHQVHQRRYSSRSLNNPLESLVEFSSQHMLDQCFPRHTERFHVEMRPGRVVFSPLANRAFSIINKFKRSSPWRAFVGLTGGVDIHVMESLGWTAEIVLEHRPMESRDRAAGRNLSEVHALNVLHNANPRILLCEDIHHLEIDRLARLLDQSPPIALAHYSLGCDDHSTAKSPQAKAESLQDLSTMLDMVYPCLRQIEAIEPVVVVVENVRGFATSAAGVMMTTVLRRMGYHISETVQSGLGFGAKQGRTRYYLVASLFPGYTPPAETGAQPQRLWPLIARHLSDCQDITHTQLVRNRELTDRNVTPYLTVDSTRCPTVLKSQDRGIKDGIYIQHEGRVYKPSVALLQELMSIPSDFDVSWMAKEQATETLGQSVDYLLHHAVMQSVTAHIEANCGRHTLIRHGLA